MIFNQGLVWKRIMGCPFLSHSHASCHDRNMYSVMFMVSSFSQQQQWTMMMGFSKTVTQQECVSLFQLTISDTWKDDRPSGSAYWAWPRCHQIEPGSENNLPASLRMSSPGHNTSTGVEADPEGISWTENRVQGVI